LAQQYEVYKCDTCGNIVSVLAGGQGEMVCDGKPMRRLVENTQDAAQEKHVPVVEVRSDGVFVKVGSVPHPMEEKHYIMWIEVIADDVAHRADLKPGMKPEAFFKGVSGSKLAVRELCNIHGLWKA